MTIVPAPGKILCGQRLLVVSGARGEGARKYVCPAPARSDFPVPEEQWEPTRYSGKLCSDRNLEVRV